MIISHVYGKASTKLSSITSVLDSHISWYSHRMKRFGFSLLIGMILLVFISCRSAPTTERTAEEIAFGEEAVKQMLYLIVSGASTTFTDEGKWTGGTADLLPADADHLILQQEQIPGISRLLNHYRDEANRAVAAIAQEIPQFVENKLLDQLTISDPYAIIEGDSDAVTRFFSQMAAEDLEQFLVERLQAEPGAAASEAWEELVETYHTYVQAQKQLMPDAALPLISEPFYQMIRISMLRTLISAMSSQEALVRTMAPAYDDPRIALFTAN